MPITKATRVAQLLNNSTGFVKDTLVDSDALNTSASLGSTSSSAGTTVYATLGDLPGSASTGAQAFVSSNSSLYIYNGSGWYKIALVNATPYWETEASTSYTFTIDTAITVTLLAGDSDGHSITYTATPDSDANQFITITKDSDNGRIFTLTPDSENEAPATSNTGNITFKASDGISFASTVSSFTLSFVTIVDNSAETILLMKATGNTSTNAAITHLIDSENSSTDFVEQNGPEASTFSPYRSGGYSTLFPAAYTDRIFVDPTNGSDFAFGTGDFTVEAWVYLTQVRSADNGIAKNWNSQSATTSGQWLFEFQGSSADLRVGDYTAGIYTTASTSCVAGVWYHVAVSREGSTVRLFVDGVSLTTSDTGGGVGSVNFSSTSGEVYIGYGLVGYIKDLRVVKGTAVYTANFTAPTEPLTAISGTELLTCHLPYFADGSTNADAVTIVGDSQMAPFGPFDYSPWSADDHGGSVKFVSTSNIKTTATAVNAVGNTASSEYTIEGWLYMESYPTTGGALFSKGTSGTTSPGDAIVVGQIRSAGAVYCSLDGNFSSSHITTADGTCPLKTWTHIALTKTSAGLHTLYVNGVSKGTYSNSSVNMSASTNAYIGGIMYDPDAAARTLNGYVADVRVTDEVIYTGAFTPPAAPLSQTSNTTLLMQNKSDANIYDAAAGSVLALNGNTQSSTSQRKFTTSSAVNFDGTGDYIELTDFETIAPSGTEDFTIEGWIYINTHKNYNFIYSSNYSNQLYLTSSGYIAMAANDGDNGTSYIVNAVDNVALSTATWYHIAYVRNGSSFKVYVNGTEYLSATSSSSIATGASVTIGAFYNSGTVTYTFNGYIQDLRITKGLARYTTAFTAPTAEFDL